VTDEEAPEAFFAVRGYRLVGSEGDGFFWVDLVAVENPDFVVPRYGRGEDRDRAMLAAKRRWIVEQATSPQRGPGTPLNS
jgi:hypothetical protein